MRGKPRSKPRKRKREAASRRCSSPPRWRRACRRGDLRGREGSESRVGDLGIAVIGAGGFATIDVVAASARAAGVSCARSSLQQCHGRTRRKDFAQSWPRRTSINSARPGRARGARRDPPRSACPDGAPRLLLPKARVPRSRWVFLSWMSTLRDDARTKWAGVQRGYSRRYAARRPLRERDRACERIRVRALPGACGPAPRRQLGARPSARRRPHRGRDVSYSICSRICSDRSARAGVRRRFRRGSARPSPQDITVALRFRDARGRDHAASLVYTTSEPKVFRREEVQVHLENGSLVLVDFQKLETTGVAAKNESLARPDKGTRGRDATLRRRHPRSRDSAGIDASHSDRPRAADRRGAARRRALQGEPAMSLGRHGDVPSPRPRKSSLQRPFWPPGCFSSRHCVRDIPGAMIFQCTSCTPEYRRVS